MQIRRMVGMKGENSAGESSAGENGAGEIGEV